MRIAVTGAFGYSGRYIARRLLDAGHEVVTLTNSPERPNPFGARVKAFPYHFDEPDKLRDSLRGVQALINTYWVRFDHRLFTHEQAVANSKVLFTAARDAGVGRIVHVSITNPDPPEASSPPEASNPPEASDPAAPSDAASDLPYFRGKAQVEAFLTDLGVSRCILRPAVLFGKEDILINNIAWTLWRFPVMGVFGSGRYKLQPIHVDDLAQAAAEAALGTGNQVVQAIGPETFTYRELIAAIAEGIGVKRPIVPVPPAVGYWIGRAVGLLVGDVVITREELRGLMEGRLCVDAPALGTTKLTEWVRQNRDTLGRRYTSEMARRVDRTSAYGSN